MAADRDDSRTSERHHCRDGSKGPPATLLRKGPSRGKQETRTTQTDSNQVIQMESNEFPEDGTIAIRLRQILLELARREDDIAHAESAGVPYWAPQPTSVHGHRKAASALRVEADRFLQAS